MSLKSETRQIQADLAMYCRDGKLPDLPGARSERLPHYRRLVYNVHYGLMEKAFPITLSRLGIPAFKVLISDFMLNHESASNQVWRLPGEFAIHCIDRDLEIKNDFPYLDDLLRMEWTEILVYNREDREFPEYSQNFPDSINAPALNPDMDIIDLDYPVFRGNWDDVKDKAGNYHLLLFRNKESKKVHFLELSSLHKKLIELWAGGMDMKTSTSGVIAEFGLEAREENFLRLDSFSRKLYSDGFILGSGSR